MTRFTGISFLLCVSAAAIAQNGNDKDARAKADARFDKGEYAATYADYSTLISNAPQDHDLNFRFGVCTLYSGDDKEKAIGFLKYATTGQVPALAWYFLGKAQHLSYHFKDALVSYEHYRGTADHKALADFPIDALEQQCRNGQQLLSNLREIDVHNKTEVAATDFFRFYDLSDIGGKIVVTPEELMTSLDKKSKERSLVYLPDKGGPIYFSSYGKDKNNGRDIYRTELLPSGKFAEPTRLAGYINTDQDEDFPFMSKDGKSFYFCSRGHNSMGGYDVFKSIYDKGMDVFGAPVNLDFAVNTPDDEELYITDPEGKEACFASGRDSKQGMLHVYRVSTAQAPVNITVIKGTFASQFDKEDRKAHIVVEDALTREQMSDVRTDMNGAYVLALPRSGKYKFIVEAGPSGRTHAGYVEVPRNDEPRAYRQEMTLVDQAGEKLVIKNYFDTPLDEDIISLALDEIKRRAKLDVGAHAVVAEQPTPEAKRDVMTRAGFPGDVKKEDALKMAQDDAAEQDSKAKALGEQSMAAFSIALENVAEADADAQRAELLVNNAKTATDDARKNDLMTQAARMRQRSHAANKRARAAYAAGRTLDAERLSTQQQAAKANKLSTDLALALQGNSEDLTAAKLVELKARMDTKNAPDASIDAAEKMRRAATEQDKEASKQLQRANESRGDETELAGRVDHLKHDETSAKGGRKQELAKQRAELETQLAALHQETEQAFGKAKSAEEQAAVARGQAALAQRLASGAHKRPVNEVGADQIAALGQRISGNQTRIAGLAIDERYDAAIADEIHAADPHTFDWDQPRSAIADNATAPTTVAQRNADATDAQHTATNTIDVQRAAQADGTPNAERMPPSSSSPDQRSNGTITADQERPVSDSTLVAQRTAANGPHNAQTGQQPLNTDAAGTLGSASGTNDQRTTNGAQAVASPEKSGDIADSNIVSAQDSTKVREASVQAATDRAPQPSTTTAVIPARTDTDLASMRGAGDPAVAQTMTPERIRKAEAPMVKARDEEPAAMPADERAFVRANQLAELQQLRLAEKNKARRDSIDMRIVELRHLMRAEEKAPNDATAVRNSEEAVIDPTQRADPNAADTLATTSASARSENTMAERVPLTFDANTSEDAVIGQVFADYANEKSRTRNSIADDRERAIAQHGLELMLVDSLDEESARQLAQLKQHADKAPVILPRMDRLRQLKEAHVQAAEDALAVSDQHYAATESRSAEDKALARTATPNAGNDHVIVASRTPHNDSYISIADEPEQVYTSTVEHRAASTKQAVAQKEKDLDTYAHNEDVIDSLESALEHTPQGKPYDALRERADRLIDDQMIMRTEMGQHMTFIDREEYKASQDSSKKLVNIANTKGIMVNEPLVHLAREMEGDAKRGMEEGTRLRKKADKSDDIIARDSLLRSAYTAELGALRDMDRALTVRNYVISDGFQHGETADYEAIERKLFPSLTADIAAMDAAAESSATPHIATPDSTALALKKRFGNYMTNETAATNASNNSNDPSSLNLTAQQASDGSRDLERRSIEAADRANAAQDSALAAKGETRARLQREAARYRALSDSLHRAGAELEGTAALLAQREQQAEAKKKLLKRMQQFYYLDDEEQALVINDEDRSRYFQARSLALEQREDAAQAHDQASGAADLAAGLLRRTADMKAIAAPTPDESAEIARIEEQAAHLRARADSLRGVEQRMLSAASLNESQAAAIIQGLDPQRATDIMAMEQRARRTEPVLAEARSTSPPVDNAPAVVPTAESSDVRPAVVNSVNDDAAEPTTSSPAAPSPVPPGLLAPIETDVFYFDTGGAKREGPIPMDAPMPVGVVFKIQIGAFRHDIPDALFNDLAPVTGESVGNGLKRYSAGMFTNAESAAKAAKQVRDRGYRDAFVVAYQDGIRVPLTQAVRAGVPATLAQRSVNGNKTPAPTLPASVHAPVEIHVVNNAFAITPNSDTSAFTRTVLAKYPASAQELLAQFKPPADATSYYNDPKAAPARQVETVKGLFFTVQVGVYSRPTALDKLFNITPLNSERTENNKIRYTTGVFIDMDKARGRKDQTVGLGVKDAFITAYLNGKRVPMGDARALLNRFGASVLVDPALATH